MEKGEKPESSRVQDINIHRLYSERRHNFESNNANSDDLGYQERAMTQSQAGICPRALHLGLTGREHGMR